MGGPKLEVLWDFIKKIMLQDEKNIRTWTVLKLLGILTKQKHHRMARDMAISLLNYDLLSWVVAELGAVIYMLAEGPCWAEIVAVTH